MGKAKAVSFLVLVLFAIAIVFIISPLIFQWAWNSFMPEVFGLPAIDFWAALGGVILLMFIGGVVRTLASG